LPHEENSQDRVFAQLKSAVEKGLSKVGLARKRSYEEENITSPSRSIEVEARSVNHD